MAEPAAHPAVTDTHLHLWDLSSGGYAWLAGAPRALRRHARWEDTSDAHARLGVRRVVLVQADDTLADTAAMDAAAARIEADCGPVERADVVAWLPLADPAATAAFLADPVRRRRVVGARHLVHDDPDPGFLDRPAVRESLEMLAADRLTVDVPDAYPRHLTQAARVAGEVQGLTVVLDHLGKPPLGDDAQMQQWEAQLRTFAGLPNTVAKLSGLSTSGQGEATPGHLRRAVELAVKLFGSQRLMFGSDWPIAPEPFDLTSGTGPLLELLDQLPPTDRAAILSETAGRVYRRIDS